MVAEIYYFNSSSAITASGGQFDEPIGSACEMLHVGYRQSLARLVVMTLQSFVLLPFKAQQSFAFFVIDPFRLAQ